MGSKISLGARLPDFMGSGGGDAERLRALKVAVFGVGAVGRNVALHVARLTPAALTLVDPKAYKSQSVLTQPIDPSDVGRPKASSTAEACRRISPQTRVESLDGLLEDLDLAVLADFDCAFLSTDNLNAEQAAGTRATALQIPLIQASVHGASLTAQVRVFGNADGAGACPLCAFGRREWADMHRETRFSCEGDGLYGGAVIDASPTQSVSALCSMAADMALTQMLRLTLGLGGAVTDTVLEYNGYRCRSVLSPLVRRADCPAEHRGWTLADAPRALGRCTLEELAVRTGVPRGRIEAAAFMVNHQRFYETGACHEGHTQPLGRFLTPGGSVPACGTCGEPTRPRPFDSHLPVPGSALREAASRPLEEITEQAPTWVLVRDAAHATMYRDPNPQSSEVAQ